MIVLFHIFAAWMGALFESLGIKNEDDDKELQPLNYKEQKRAFDDFINEAKLNIQHSAETNAKPVLVTKFSSLDEVDSNNSNHSTTNLQVSNFKRPKYIDFPFLNDESTIFHIMNSHVMFVMRGVAGSGKSTIVKLLTETYQNAVVCSADDYFLVDGEYHFNMKELEYAHKNCQSKAYSSCEKGMRTIIIDNTNVRKWEMNYYFQLASQFGYVVITVLPQTPWRFNPEELAKRNKHGVSADVLSAKVEKFDRVNPLYWAWFLNREDGDTLLRLVEKYFNYCCENFPRLRDTIIKYQASLGNTDVEMNHFKLYNLKTNYHCTAFFGGRGKNALPEANIYALKPSVMAAMGQCQNLSVTGINITAKTIGARVQLSQTQLDLWGKDDHEMVTEANVGKLKPGSRAHVTLGFSSGTDAVQTGFDQIHLAELELQGTRADLKEVEDGVFKCYPDGTCTLEFRSPLMVKSLFSGYY